MRRGRSIIGSDHLALAADRLYLFEVSPVDPTSFVVGSLIVHLDGLGAGSGEQTLRPAVMEAGNPASLALGDEAVVAQSQTAGWQHLTFSEPSALRADVQPLVGFHAGPAGSLARLSVALGNAGVSERYTATYGNPIVLGSPTDVSALASIVAVGVTPWTAPAVTDDEFAGLPIDVAQVALAGSPVSVVDAAVCGWHYSADSPPPPASAIVRTGGPLEQLVGERVRVTAPTATGPASVVVVVVDEQPFDDRIEEDLSLARDAFMRIGALWADTRTVSVEVIA